MQLFNELKLLKRKTRQYNFLLRVNTYFFKLWEKILCRIFSYNSRCFERESVSPILTLSNACQELKYFADHFHALSLSRRIICKVTMNRDDIVLCRRLLKLVYETNRHPEVCDFATAEILCKVLAYRNLEVGDVFDIPTVSDGRVEQCSYRVEQIFDLWNKMVAFGLSSDTGPPIILFRSTDFNIKRKGGWASMLSDFDPDGPGHTIFSRFRPELEAFATKPARVMGHSLGGAFASYSAIYHPELLSDCHNSFAFNSPGLERSVLEKCPERSKQFISFITRGDLISKFGHLFGKTLELTTTFALSPVSAHQLLMFAQPKCYIYAIKTEEENTSASRKYYSFLQQKTTSLAYRFGLKYLFPNPYR